MSMLFPAPTPPGVPRNLVALFNQGKWWKSAEGWVRVKHMTPAHRLNVARALMRNAKIVEDRYSMIETVGLYDAPDEVWNVVENEAARRRENPAGWLRETKLYRKLINGVCS